MTDVRQTDVDLEKKTDEVWEEEQDIEEIVIQGNSVIVEDESVKEQNDNTVRDKLYGRLPFTVRQMDIFIGVIVVIIIGLLIYSGIVAGN